MEDMEEHPLLTRFPEDADWEQFDNMTLLRQCLVRNIPSEGISRDNKIRLLQNYRKKHVTEIRKIPWRRSPSRFTREEKGLRLNRSIYQITQVKDMSSSNGTVFRKEFTLSDEKGLIYVVAFKEIPTCTCPSQPTLYHCDHIMYLLLVVLNCPEPLCWQAAFLPSELEVIYRHSHAIRTLLFPKKSKDKSTLCVLCFRSLVVVDDKIGYRSCRKCGRSIHRGCFNVALRVRRLNEAADCWICKDTSEWNIEKYRKQNQIPAATAAATIASAMPTPTTNIVQQSRGIEHKDKDDHGVRSSSSSKKQDDKDTQVNDNAEVNQRPSHPSQSSSLFSSSSSNFPTPSRSAVNHQELLPPPTPQQPSQTSKDVAPQLKGSISLPAVPPQRSTSAPPPSNLEPMRLELKQTKAQDLSGKPPQGVSQDCSPALAKSLSSVPSVQYPISTASTARARTVGQAGQTPVLSAVGIESQNSAATAAGVLVQAATPVLPDGIPGVVDSPSPVSNVDADVHRREAARLVRKYRRLEKETSHIREHAEREIKKIDKEYKRKLKRLEEKRKRIDKKRELGLKKLGLKRERLEKELKTFERS